LREAFKSPAAYRNLETVGNAFMKHMEASGPQALSAFQARINAMVKR
jgi:hypothetical protein